MTNPIPVNVVTRDLSDPDAAPIERLIDFRKPDDQKWLRNHMWYAFHNGRSVTSYPVD